MSNTRERVTFFYESEDDRDIHDWIKSLPERGKTSYIQKAIRYYLEHSTKESVTEVAPKELQAVLDEMKSMRKRIEQLEKVVQENKLTPINAVEVPKEEKSTDLNDEDIKYVDGSNIFDTLGK